MIFYRLHSSSWSSMQHPVATASIEIFLRPYSKREHKLVQTLGFLNIYFRGRVITSYLEWSYSIMRLLNYFMKRFRGHQEGAVREKR